MIELFEFFWFLIFLETRGRGERVGVFKNECQVLKQINPNTVFGFILHKDPLFFFRSDLVSLLLLLF